MQTIFSDAAREVENIRHPGMTVVFISALANAQASQGNIIEAHRLLAQARQKVWGRNSDNDNISMLSTIAGLEARLGLKHTSANSLNMIEDLITRQVQEQNIQPRELDYALTVLAYASMEAGDQARARKALQKVSSTQTKAQVLVAIARSQAQKGLLDEARESLRETAENLSQLEPKEQTGIAESLQALYLEFGLQSDTLPEQTSPRLAQLQKIRADYAKSKPDILQARLSELLKQQPLSQWTETELIRLLKFTKLIDDIAARKQIADHTEHVIAKIPDTKKRDQLYSSLAALYATFNDFTNAQEAIKKISKGEQFYGYNQILPVIARQASQQTGNPPLKTKGTLAYLRETENNYEIILRDLATMQESVVPDAHGKLKLSKEERSTGEKVKILDATPADNRLLVSVKNQLIWINWLTGESGNFAEINTIAPFVQAVKISPDKKQLAILGGKSYNQLRLYLASIDGSKSSMLLQRDSTEDAVWNPDNLSWSPSGKSLIFVENERKLVEFDIASRKSRVLTEKTREDHVQLYSPAYGARAEDIFIIEIINGMGIPSRIVQMKNGKEVKVLHEDAMVLLDSMSYMGKENKQGICVGRAEFRGRSSEKVGEHVLLYGLDNKNEPLIIGHPGWNSSSPVYISGTSP